jgi:hypothetical protein
MLVISHYDSAYNYINIEKFYLVRYSVHLLIYGAKSVNNFRLLIKKNYKGN